MAYELVIKGDANDAARALVSRGFHPSDVLTLPSQTQVSPSHVVSYCTVRRECEPGVQRWFTETPDVPPFPAGTLLFYSQVEGGSARGE